jgi:hypothetical protein
MVVDNNWLQFGNVCSAMLGADSPGQTKKNSEVVGLVTF